MVCEATKSNCAPLWPCNERKTEFIHLPGDTLDEVIELNLEWLDEIEKKYWGNFKRLDEYETQNKNEDALTELISEFETIIVNGKLFKSQIEGIKQSKELAETKKTLLTRITELLEMAETALEKCNGHHSM